jgi:hypothetical protein
MCRVVCRNVLEKDELTDAKVRQNNRQTQRQPKICHWEAMHLCSAQFQNSYDNITFKVEADFLEVKSNGF